MLKAFIKKSITFGLVLVLAIGMISTVYADDAQITGEENEGAVLTPDSGTAISNGIIMTPDSGTATPNGKVMTPDSGVMTPDSGILPPDEPKEIIDISDADIDIDVQTYTGGKVKPEPVVAVDDVVLEKGKDYTVTYKNNVNAGTATAVITGIGTYTGTVKGKFEIEAKAITPKVTLSKTSYVYNGKARKPSVTVKDGKNVLVQDEDYTVTYSKGRINVGTYKVTVTLQGNYEGSAKATFKITAKEVTPTIVLSKSSFTYSGKAVKPSVIVKDGNNVLAADQDYTVKYSKGRTKAGTYKVSVTLQGNYEGSAKASFKINAKSIAKAKVTIKDQAYTGKNLKPNPTVVVNSVTLKKGTDYTVSYAKNKKVGTAKVTIKGIGNYKGTINASFKIKNTNTIKVKAASKTLSYKKVKKNKQVVAALTVKKAQGKVTYKKVSGNKNFTVNKTNGKITVKKGTPKGKYKIVINVTAAGNSKFLAKTARVTVVIQVK